jgi:shikimate dehydrogenase
LLKDSHTLGPAVLLGLIGAGIGASRTPAMHEREAAAQQLRLIYKLIDIAVLGLDVAALPDLLTAAQRFGFAGVNVTHPCKQAVIPLLDELSEDAAALGAVNTVLFRDGKRIGHNTDWSGFAEGFRRFLPGAPLGRVVQIGAGGAGAAVAHAALTLGVEQLTILDIDLDRARAVAGARGRRFHGQRVEATTDLAAALADADGVINTTPLGMAKYPGMPVPAALLRPPMWVAEIVYFPLETELLRTARALGCRTLDGGGMAVFQAVEAFRLFTGMVPDAERMLRHFAAMNHAQAARDGAAGRTDAGVTSPLDQEATEREK